MAIPTTAIMRAEEEQVFFELYTAVRSRELRIEAWDSVQRDQLLRLQFNAQRRGYRGRYPAMVERFVLRDGVPIGWIMSDSSEAVVRCVDMAIVPEERRKGAATLALRELQEEAAVTDRPLVLSALRTNAPALALYGRLGFTTLGENDAHVLLEWRGPVGIRV
jgi:GNAT superfamily N-acetyltransferase